MPLHAPDRPSTRAPSALHRTTSRTHGALLRPVENAIVVIFTLVNIHLRHLASRSRPATASPHLTLVDFCKE